jgi:hypothetical protein
MLRGKTVKQLATILSVALAATGIAMVTGMPANASTVASAAATPAVQDCGTGAALTRPSSLILTCADRRMVASHLRWRNWNAADATATSTVTWLASAAQQGHTTANVTLSSPVSQPGGQVLFTKLSLQVTGATPPGFIRDVTFSEAPGQAAGPAEPSPRSLRPEPAAASGTLDTAAIGGYWELAGGPSSVAETAEAITGAEASFEPGIIQPGMPYWLTGWGLWQITPGDSVPALGEDYQLLDPWNNAEAAVYKYDDAGGFFPWTTYVDGAYENFLQYTSTPNTNLTDPGQYDPVNSSPPGTNNGSDPGSTYGPPIPGPPQFAFTVVVQSNDNVLTGYNSSSTNFPITSGLKAGTSPSVAELSDGTYEAAFEASNDNLGLSQLGRGTLHTTLGMAAGTSPAIAALPGGGWIAAFQDNASKLYLYDSWGDTINTDLGMATGTSPAIAAGGDGSYKVVFQDNDHVLAGYNSSGSNFTTTLGMDPDASPSLAAEPDGTYEAAFEANNDNLATIHIGTGISVNPTSHGMDRGTTPAVTAQANDTFMVVFQDNDKVLAGYNSSGGSFTTALGMKAGTSPALVAEPDGTYEAAFEANNDNLATIHIGTGISVNPTTLGMDNATGPAITY